MEKHHVPTDLEKEINASLMYDLKRIFCTGL